MKKCSSAQKSFDPPYTSLHNWIQHEAIPLSLDSSESFNISIDNVIMALEDSVELLGFREALHGGEDILILRNRLFKRLSRGTWLQRHCN